MALCEECDSFESIYKCDECDQVLCEECDKRIHNKGKRTKHIRRLITTDKSIKVFWDYQTHPDQELAYTLKSLQDHCKELGGQAQVYCYSHQPIYCQGLATIKVSNEESIQKRIVYEICRQQGDISLLYSFCQEQSKLTLIEYIRKSKAKVFILTALSVKPFQLVDSPSIQSTPPKIQQIIIQQTTNAPSHETQNYQHPRFHSAGVQGFQMNENQIQSYNKYSKQIIELIPQNQHEKVTSNKQVQELQKLMFQLASQGDLMIEQNRLLQYIIEKIGWKREVAEVVLMQAEQAQIIHFTKRLFGSSKTLIFVSLLLNKITLESLRWILESLKIDEMTPNERSIQSRIKEAFALKLTAPQWEQLIQASRMTERQNSQFKFSVTEVPDPVTQILTIVIYPYGEGWDISENNDIKSDPAYEVFLQFLQNFFTGNLEEFWATYDQKNQSQIQRKKIWSSSIESSAARHEHKKSRGSVDCEGARAIPGGRYGCAQFLKTCGPSILKECSLGKLSQMVQQAINDDILRYHRTLLMWTASLDKKKNGEEEVEKSQIQLKIQLVKNAIIEVLSESRQGISLAQLPQHLKKKLRFPLDFNELGVAKLKDLLNQMIQVKIELRNSNHPFAVLIPTELEDIINELNELLCQFPSGIQASRVQPLLQHKLGYSIDFKKFDCNNIKDFVQQYGIAEWQFVEQGYQGPI